MTSKWPTLILLSLAELLAMGLWFSATAVVPALTTHWEIDTSQAAWLTMAVQLGFVVGALTSALTNLPDHFEPRKVIAAGAFGGAVLTAILPAASVGFGLAVVLRFGTGASLALVYPVGMKIIATWTREDRGLAIGILVGALTIGSAGPHFLRSLGDVDDWRAVLYTGAALAAIGGIIAIRWGRLGPYGTAAAPFRWRQMGRSLTVRSLRLANFGYFGHMWELYGMWTWIPLFLLEAYSHGTPTSDGVVERLSSLGAFAVIGIGGVGSLLAGRLADRWGRTNTTMLSMIVSGTCALTIGLLIDIGPIAVTAMAVVWGFAIVADSAQFSASVSELSDPEYVGTQLTTQTAIGFLITMASIQLIPVVVDLVGWRWAFAALAPGPALGTWAMATLKRAPEAQRLAGGRG